MCTKFSKLKKVFQKGISKLEPMVKMVKIQENKVLIAKQIRKIKMNESL